VVGRNAIAMDTTADLRAARPHGSWELVWRRLKRDRVALGSAVALVFVFFACFAGEPIAEHFLGHGPNDIFPMAVDENLVEAPVWSHVPNAHGVVTVTPHTPRTLFVLGASDQVGHDLFLRVLAGGRTSLEIALGAAALAVLLGVVLGLLAGYYGRWVDAVFTRGTEFAMGFPILIFVIAIGFTVSDRLERITLGGHLAPGVISLIVLIGLFSWFYPARVVRAQVLTLRNSEFVEAARMVGASDLRIVRQHLLPHVLESVIVYGTLMVAGTMFLEAGFSYLNLGVQLPDATWGNLIAQHYGTLLFLGAPNQNQEAPALHNVVLATFLPATGILTVVFSFSLLGEAVRNALDPRGRL
jgi:ABC-type dipeptide/oligopeptide/nickel transport system permease subunit